MLYAILGVLQCPHQWLCPGVTQRAWCLVSIPQTQVKWSQTESIHLYFPEGSACIGILSQNLQEEKIWTTVSDDCRCFHFDLPLSHCCSCR